MSDTRTNAGVDDISIFRKMFTWEVPGNRFITIMTAGNLATTQAVISILDERSKSITDRDPSILKAPSMFQVAQLIGETLKEVIQGTSDNGQNASASFGASMIVGGQIKGSNPCLFNIYPEGNFIEATQDTPFFQIGETKYGRPILVRAYDGDMSFEEAITLLLVSFDSTVKANLSVGLPFDFQVYERDSFVKGKNGRIEKDDPYYEEISDRWGCSVRDAFKALPEYGFKD